MKTKFGLVLDVRDDGTKVWAAECQRCGAVIVGERCPPVTIIRARIGTDPIPAQHFDRIRKQVHDAWLAARKTGSPIVMVDDRFTISSTHDHGDLQRALEAHEDACLPKPG